MYNYWFVGYVTNNGSAQGRVEVFRSERESPFAEREVHIKFPSDWTTSKINDFTMWVDDLTSEEIILSQDKFFEMFNSTEDMS